MEVIVHNPSEGIYAASDDYVHATTTAIVAETLSRTGSSRSR
jgi:hypothetical protein